MNKFYGERTFLLLQAAVLGVFLGRAWQHLYWDAPYRTLFWDETVMKLPVRQFLGMEWEEFIYHPGVETGIVIFIQVIGGFYILCALAALMIRKFPKVCRPILFAGGLSLLLLAFLYAKEKFYLAAQFFEYSLQWGSPFIFLAFTKKDGFTPRLILWTKIAIALTFTCHGLFALGVYPTPGYFVEMTMYILGLSQHQAIVFLKVAGGLDLFLSVLIFLPGRVAYYALAYAVFWGAATTMARVWAYAMVMQWDDLLLQWLHESVMRFPHFLVPLALLLFLRTANQRTSEPVVKSVSS